MAGSPADDEQSVYDSGRLSLLDLILEKSRAQNKKQLVHRLYYVAKIRQEISDRRDIGGKWHFPPYGPVDSYVRDWCHITSSLYKTNTSLRRTVEASPEGGHLRAHYERLFKNLQIQITGEAVTGLLLIYPMHIVHVLESSSNVLFEVIRDLEEEVNSISGSLQQSKLLCFTGDLPNRLFSQWCFRTLSLSGARIQDYTTNETINVAVMEALHQILKLGEYLAKLPKISLTKAMDSLSEKVPEFLVRQDLIEYLVNSKNLSTPTEYLKRYVKPLDVVLDSELVWPMQTKLFPLSKT